MQVPVDLLKIRLQLQTASPSDPSYLGPLAMARRVVSQEGAAGLFRGTAVTLIRDVPSFGVYFGVYHGACRLAGVNDASEALPALQLAAGGAAGVISWASIYPIDVIKSRIQAGGFPAAPASGRERAGWLAVGAAAVRAGGWASLFKGLNPTLGRALVVNGVTFAGYEAAVRALSGSS